MDVTCCDFDGVRFRVLVDHDDLSVLEVSASASCWADLSILGAPEHLKSVYGDYLQETSSSNYDVTLKVPLDSVPADCEKLAEDISLLKAHLVGAPFFRYFTALKEGASMECGQFSLSEDTVIYLVPKPDRVIVIFSFHFKEKSDEVIARAFLNSMSDSPKGSMPPCRFDFNPSDDLKNNFGIEEPIGNVGFIQFALLDRHVATQDKISTAAKLFVNFRQYLGYHVKCSKTYFHSHMRDRVRTLLGTLNQAKTSTSATKKRTTASGKTFEKYNRA